MGRRAEANARKAQVRAHQLKKTVRKKIKDKALTKEGAGYLLRGLACDGVINQAEYPMYYAIRRNISRLRHFDNCAPYCKAKNIYDPRAHLPAVARARLVKVADLKKYKYKNK